MDIKLKVGDWVNSYSKGIHRIADIVDRYYDESCVLGNNRVGDKYAERIVVSKRLLNSRYKKSVGYDSCSERFITPLTSEQSEKLNEVLVENPHLLEELDRYQIPTLVSVHNSQLQIDTEEDLQLVNAMLVFVQAGRSFLEIENEMRRLGLERLKPRNFGNYDLQLVNYNMENRDRRTIWREANLSKRR